MRSIMLGMGIFGLTALLEIMDRLLALCMSPGSLWS